MYIWRDPMSSQTHISRKKLYPGNVAEMVASGNGLLCGMHPCGDCSCDDEYTWDTFITCQYCRNALKEEEQTVSDAIGGVFGANTEIPEILTDNELSIVAEFLPAGKTYTVNGRELEGFLVEPKPRKKNTIRAWNTNSGIAITIVLQEDVDRGYYITGEQIEAAKKELCSRYTTGCGPCIENKFKMDYDILIEHEELGELATDSKHYLNDYLMHG